MATKKAAGKPLVIVESPAKARTIGRFLGGDYMIEASIGHIRDLPANAAEVPPALKKEPWSRLGIDIEHDFKPLYVVPRDKREQIKKLKERLKSASTLYLATDEDREGESISWHLLEELKPKVEVRRLVFHEITRAAIEHALAHPRDIDEALVEAQETRRLVDRLYGYSVSPLLWKKIRPKLSAGRVQSVAVRLVVEREKERMRFRAADYWDLLGTFRATESKPPAPFDATLVTVGKQRVASGRDFDPETGKLKAEGASAGVGNTKGAEAPLHLPLHLTEAKAKELLARLRGKQATVQSVEKKPYTERPAPPFTTSTLQQEAGRKLRFTAQRTMRAAQRLYEHGYITYMRTDSTNLSSEALTAARRLIATQYGEQHLPDSPRQYQTKVRNAQEAHEAIRPAGAQFAHPRELGGDANDDDRRVYELIWQRTVASQMKDARGHRTTLVVAVDDAHFQASGKTIEYPGFRLAYVEDTEDLDAAMAEQERILPAVTPGQQLATDKIDAQGHTTQPPARLTEASLVKEMEARGIGRPSTYASIIETIQARDYCFKKGTALVPTFTAFAVTKLLDQHLSWLVDYEFTARMESELDDISNGRAARIAYLRTFYSGNGKPGLKGNLEQAERVIDPREVCSIPLGEGPNGLIEVRIGRYGPFLSSGETRVSLPDDMAPDELTLEKAQDLLAKGEAGPRSLGTDPETGLPIYVKVGRFGPYFQRGLPEQLDGDKPKMASLLAGMDPETVDLDTALAVLALPREVGHQPVPDAEGKPGSGDPEPIVAANGRFGPYLKWGKETRSIPAGESPLSITLERALQILAQPKQRGRQGARGASARTVLKELGSPPGKDATIKVLEGRYGPYVTDGEINASVPKGTTVEELTLEHAVDLLAARAAQGGGAPGKKARGRRTPGKKAAKKSPAGSSRGK